MIKTYNFHIAVTSLAPCSQCSCSWYVIDTKTRLGPGSLKMHLRHVVQPATLLLARCSAVEIRSCTILANLYGRGTDAHSRFPLSVCCAWRSHSSRKSWTFTGAFVPTSTKAIYLRAPEL